MKKQIRLAFRDGNCSNEPTRTIDDQIDEAEFLPL
jgi:hypothetical protein